jgi:hypothetical protein
MTPTTPSPLLLVTGASASRRDRRHPFNLSGAAFFNGQRLDANPIAADAPSEEEGGREPRALTSFVAALAVVVAACPAASQGDLWRYDEAPLSGDGRRRF